MIFFKRRQVLDIVQTYLSSNPLIVEAGAFLGHDTIKMATRWPQGVVHTFEPIPPVFQELVTRTTQFPNIRCHERALSTVTGVLPLHVSYKPTRTNWPTQASSLHAPFKRNEWSPIQFPHTIQVPTVTLPDWMHQHQISKIDLLWLDLQGHELAVLQGAVDVLPQVQVIHTEVYFDQAYHNQPTHTEVVNWLESQNFVAVAQDFQNPPDWHFGNMIFVKK
jgi:FkbM family methyltransferase